MSRFPVARPISLELPGFRRTRPSAVARAAAIASLFMLLGSVSFGLLAVAFRPIGQSVTEMSQLPAAEAISELDETPSVDDNPELIEPGEARPRPGFAHAAPADAAETETPAKPETVEPAPAAPAGERFGTAVDFVRAPSIAFGRAAREQKLVMLLHVAGNFEDPGFT